MREANEITSINKQKIHFPRIFYSDLYFLLLVPTPDKQLTSLDGNNMLHPYIVR